MADETQICTKKRELKRNQGYRLQVAGCVFTFRRSSANAFTFEANRLHIFRPTKKASGCIQTRPTIVKDIETITSLQP